MKRKAKVEEIEGRPWALLAPEMPPSEQERLMSADPDRTVVIRCIYESRLIIGTTPSGARYEFEPGQEKPVSEVDYYYLLSLTQKNGCCGGPTTPQFYFEEV